MRKVFSRLEVFKTVSILMLILVLVLSPCGVKQSLKQIFNVDNISSHTIKTGSSCQYISVSATQKTQQAIVKKQEFQNAIAKFSGQFVNLTAHQDNFPKARSVPLYILYQQLRFSLI